MIALLVQFIVAVYGGYFGAGLGILVLAALSLVGVGEIQQANGLKNLFSIAVKGVAATYFVATRAVVWHVAILMLLGAIAGGYAAAALGCHIEKRVMRWLIVLIGVFMAVAMFTALGR